jgi:hypothetical protein
VTPAFSSTFRWKASVEANASLDSVKPRFAARAHVASLFGTHTEEAGDQGSQEEVASDRQESSETPKPLPTSLSQEDQATLALQNDARHAWTLPTGSTRSPGEAAVLSTHGGLSGEHHRPGCDPHADQARTRYGLSYPTQWSMVARPASSWASW